MYSIVVVVVFARLRPARRSPLVCSLLLVSALPLSVSLSLCLSLSLSLSLCVCVYKTNCFYFCSMFSGCMDSQTSADVQDVSKFGLPDADGAGGACTNAMLLTLVGSHGTTPTTDRTDME